MPLLKAEVPFLNPQDEAIARMPCLARICTADWLKICTVWLKLTNHEINTSQRLTRLQFVYVNSLINCTKLIRTRYKIVLL